MFFNMKITSDIQKITSDILNINCDIQKHVIMDKNVRKWMNTSENGRKHKKNGLIHMKTDKNIRKHRKSLVNITSDIL